MSVIMRFYHKLKENRGYALMLVISIFALFTVLCVNVLTASYSTMGSAAQKYASSQAYYLAVSSLDVVSKGVEEGVFQDLIDAEDKTQTEFNLPNGAGKGTLSVEFRMLSARTLAAKVTIRYEKGEISVPYTAYATYLQSGGGWIRRNYEGGSSSVAKAWAEAESP